MLIAPTVILALFAVIIIWLGWIHGDSTSLSGYTMAGRRASWIAVAFGSFTVVGAGELVGITAYTYDLGLYSFAFFAGIAVGALVLAALGPSAKRAASNDTDSLPDYVGERYGRVAALLTTIISVAGLGALLVIQFAVGGAALSALLLVPEWIAVVGVATVVVIYVWVGGLKAIFFTDIVQGIAMFIFVALILGWTITVTSWSGFVASVHMYGLPDVVGTNDHAALTFAVVLFVSGATAVSGGADLWQRLFAASDPSQVRRGMGTTALLFLGFGMLLCAWSVYIVSVLPDIDNTNVAFVHYLASEVPLIILGAAAVGLFAALISTADAELLVVSVILSNEGHRWGFNKARDVQDSRQLALAVAVAATAVAVLVTERLAEVFSILLFILMIAGATAWVALSGRGSHRSLALGQITAIGTFVVLWYTDLLFVGLWSLLLLVPVLLSLLVGNSNEQGVGTKGEIGP